MKRASATVLGFDYGLRNIGVAVGNRELGTCQPLTVVRARDGAPDWDAISRCIEEWQPGLAVVGEPLNMDGSTSDMSTRAQRFARQLEGRYQITTVLVDERLSSREAKQQAFEQGHRGDFGEKPIDADAAALILQTWLSEAAP
jgi:putative Holliday junction resolvase